MKKLLFPAAMMAISVLGVAGAAHAGTGDDDDYTPTTAVEQLPPVLPPEPEPVLTVPPVSNLPVTGSNSNDTLVIATLAVAAGGGLVLVAKSRRRSSHTPA